MLALHQAGRRAEALVVYQAGRRQLVEALGVEPGPQLRAVYEARAAGRAKPGTRTSQPAARTRRPGRRAIPPCGKTRQAASSQARRCRPS